MIICRGVLALCGMVHALFISGVPEVAVEDPVEMLAQQLGMLCYDGDVADEF